jgi:hypothetical protein
MRLEIVQLLKSPKRYDRMRGWTELHTDCVSKQYVLSKDDILFLVTVLHNEEDDGVKQHGQTIMTELIAVLLANGLLSVQPYPQAEILLESVYDWLWDPLHETSVVFGVTADLHLRDGIALVELGRRLPKLEFPATAFVHVPFGQPQWGATFYQQGHVQAVVLVGRIGLFGEEAIRRLSCSDSRFGFLTHERPVDCPPHGLDDQYHCLYERLGSGEREYHRTIDKDGERTDFALVQRYTVEHAGRQIVVIHCAGNTFLGTIGAAQWAASPLKCSAEKNSPPIPCPANIQRDSTLEALLEVKADVNKPVWTPPKIKLLELTAAGATWSQTTGKWHIEITLRCENGDPRKPLTVFFGKEKEPMNHTSQAFRLLTAVCLLSREGQDGRVDLDKLTKDKWIWSDKQVGERQVRSSLAGLKHCHKKLRDVLSNDSEVRLYANVKIQSVEPAAVGAARPACKGRKKDRRGSEEGSRKPR